MKKNTSNFLLGLLAGAAAGAIAGIIFAPDKGSATRQNLGKKVRELSDEYGLGLSDLMDELGVGSKHEHEPKSKITRTRPATGAKRKYNRKPKINDQ